jgi:hypothetical protein
MAFPGVSQFPVRIMTLGRITRNFKTHWVAVEDSMKATKPAQLLFDSGVIDQMNSVHEMRGRVFQDD